MVAPKNIKDLQDASRDLRVTRINASSYTVKSQSNPDADYRVQVTFDDSGRTVQASCDCAWATYNGIACSHVLATLEYMASLKARTLSFWNNEDVARRQKHRLFQLQGNDDKQQDQIWITSRNT